MEPCQTPAVTLTINPTPCYVRELINLDAIFKALARDLS